MGIRDRLNLEEQAAYDAWLFKWLSRFIILGIATAVVALSCGLIAAGYGVYQAALWLFAPAGL